VRRVLLPVVLALPIMVVSVLPLQAQFRFSPSRQPAPRPGSVGQVFIPGFGFQPIVQERHSVFGLDFDAHHFNALHRRRSGFSGRFHSGFSGRIGGRNTSRFGFGFASVPFLPFAGTGSSVVVIQQAVPVAVPAQEVRVVTLEESSAEAIPVVAGLPANWGRVRFVRPSYPRETPRPPRLTLLVLEGETIIPARDYWLEDGRIFYVTSTGRQDSFPLRDLDWEMTTELNAQRSVDFRLRSLR